MVFFWGVGGSLLTNLDQAGVGVGVALATLVADVAAPTGKVSAWLFRFHFLAYDRRV